MFGQKSPKQPSRREIEQKIRQFQNELELHYLSYRDEIDRYKSQDCPKWEYLQRRDLKLDELQHLGQIGWELVSVTSYSLTTQQAHLFNSGEQINTVYLMYIFKRPYRVVAPEIEVQIRSLFPQIEKLEMQIIKLKSMLD